MTKERILMFFLSLHLIIILLFAYFLYQNHQQFQNALLFKEEAKNHVYYLELCQVKQEKIRSQSGISPLQKSLPKENLSRHLASLPVFSFGDSPLSPEKMEELTQMLAALFHTRASIFTYEGQVANLHHFTASMDGGTVHIWFCHSTNRIETIENKRPIRSKRISETQALQYAQNILHALGYTQKFPQHIHITENTLQVDFLPKTKGDLHSLSALRLHLALDNGRLTAFSRLHLP